MWLFFISLHLVGITGYNLILRRALVDKIEPFTLATIMQTGIAIPMAIALFVATPDASVYSAKICWLVVAVTLLTIALHVTNVYALKYLEASVYSVLFNLRILFATVLGIVFVNEKIIPLQIFGGALIFLAVVVVRQKGRSDLTRRGLEWGVGASVVISVLNLFEKELISQIPYLDYAIPAFLISAILMWLYLIFGKIKVDLSLFKDPKILSLMAFRTVSAYGFGLALYHGKLSLTSYISSLSVIVIVVLGMIILGERDYFKQKVFATCMAAIGLTAILIANLI